MWTLKISPQQVIGDKHSSTVSLYITPMMVKCLTAYTHTHLTAFFSGTTWVGQYQKGKTNLDFTEARDSEWQWHQLG